MRWPPAGRRKNREVMPWTGIFSQAPVAGLRMSKGSLSKRQVSWPSALISSPSGTGR